MLVYRIEILVVILWNHPVFEMSFCGVDACFRYAGEGLAEEDFPEGDGWEEALLEGGLLFHRLA